ncbi:polysaccharide deacetylase family protein [Streptomyces sp. NPDC059552]|uniref:polysaccharide deacetylase family protein n=1 Tax=Streptomyces sp. NPDC059552 TaxID=3346862 RepID=UPI003693A84A
MKNDEPTVGRRTVLRTAVFLGVAAASGLLTVGTEDGAPGAGPGGGSGPQAGPGAQPAAGAPGLRAQALPEKSYRLRPMTAEEPMRPAAVKPAVRTRPILELPAEAAASGGMVLTFDDGPDPRYTPAILDTLARHGVRAMFFVCGEMATENRDLLRRMVAEGHVIGNHTWTHPLIPGLSRPALVSEIGRTSEVVQQTVGEGGRGGVAARPGGGPHPGGVRSTGVFFYKNKTDVIRRARSRTL